ncbi:plasmid-like protein [Desulfofundulus kuznetsovii DSM 6115]|uniref:Plasmid-like protein n=1 Tax=Desulfofundulus kuznetsovii (strain DSM 6115 / VKM B-1805 / 17) TaxID=760568 RepID=A0AAU8PXE5_DESK7|nr:plasmid-like protein [Desulfofundulus kuznetsovii DSM 6115]
MVRPSYMARLASEAKGGYYPTPPKEMGLVCKKLRVEPGTKVNVIDPCAGEGDALKMASDHLKSEGGNIVTYGIEIEATRAEKCRSKLDRVVRCGYEEARVTPKAFSFMWLNPPYNERGGERAEVTFLRDLTDPVSGKLMNGGVLGYCIPQYVLTQAAPILAARFDDLAVYRFTDENFPVFKQIVVFGVRRAKARQGSEAREIREWLKELSRKEGLPVLDANDGVTYLIPESPAVKITFRGSVTDPLEVGGDIVRSPVWEEIKYLLPMPRKVSSLKPPVLPLKPAHDAVAIAAGAIGGNMGTHLLVGMTKKVVDRQVIPEEKGEKVIETERPRTTIRVFTPEGIYELE